MDPVQQNAGGMGNVIIAILLIAVVGGGGFYYWTTTQEEVTTSVVDTNETTEVSSFSDTPSSVPGYITYTSAPHGFSIDYPEAWSKDETSSLVPVAFYAPFSDAFDLFQDNLNVTTEDTTYYGEVTLQEYSDAGLANIQLALPEYVVVDQGTRTFGKGDYEGAYLLGNYSTQGIDLQIYSLFTLVDGTAYVVTYTYESSQAETYQATADAMIASFQIGS